MTEAAATQPAAPFPARTILILVLVGLFAFSAFVVLSTYAPDLREKADGGGHALSRSAVGFAGAVALLRAQGEPVLVSRARTLDRTTAALVVLTPGPTNTPEDLSRLASDNVTLVVLPKWTTEPDPLHPGWVSKRDLLYQQVDPGQLLGKLAKTSLLVRRDGVGSATLRLAPGVSASTPEGRRIAFGAIRTGRIDRLQTLSGDGWRPVIVDEHGRGLVAESAAYPNLYVLADPDILNTQGLASLDTARAASALIEVLRSSRDGVVFDVTLQGFGRSRSLGKLMLEPPLLGATLCALAAALLMGAHALARFGPTPPSARAFALGGRGLVDNSASLIRMARREAELAPSYAALVENQVLKAAGGAATADRLDRLEQSGRVSARRADLARLAQDAKTPDDLLSVARHWRQWRVEMTRDRH